MQRHLLYGTALVAASMLAAGGAAAQDKKMMSKPAISVNGYYEAVVGGILDEDYTGNVPADTSALDTRTDAEIHFNGRGTTDNGLKIHARVELEGQNNHSMDGSAGGDVIDEYFLSVSGAFGQIVLGGTGGVPNRMLTGISGSFATGVGESLGYDMSWIGASRGAGKNRYGAYARIGDHDAEKISYISPKFGGFQIGATYSPNGFENNDDNSRVNAEDNYHDGLEGAASYSGKFGDVSFAVGGGMVAYKAGTKSGAKDKSEWLVASRLDFGGGFRVAIAHRSNTDDDKSDRFNLTDGGVRYVAGANSFSLGASYTEHESKETETRIMGSYARSMGPGVKVHLNLLHVAAENGMSGDDKVESSGATIVSGIKVSF